jgi:hypothetical protein
MCILLLTSHEFFDSDKMVETLDKFLNGSDRVNEDWDTMDPECEEKYQKNYLRGIQIPVFRRHNLFQEDVRRNDEAIKADNDVSNSPEQPLGSWVNFQSHLFLVPANEPPIPQLVENPKVTCYA